MHVSGKRVLRLLRRDGLLAPQRATRRRKPRLHDGKIITDAPNLRWGTDGTMAWTVEDGWVLVFDLVDHYTAEAWAHVAKVGDRFAALQPVYDAVIDRHGVLAADVARGLEVRHDWGGSQYGSAHFTGSLAWLGITDSPAYPGEPECNGCARTVDQDAEGAMPVGAGLPQRRRPASRRRRLRRALQHPVADRTPRPPHTPRDLPAVGCRQDGSRVIVNQPVQGTGSGSPICCGRLLTRVCCGRLLTHHVSHGSVPVDGRDISYDGRSLSCRWWRRQPTTS